MVTAQEMADRMLRQIADAGLSHLHTLSEIHDVVDLDSLGDMMPMIEAIETDEQLVAFCRMRGEAREIIAERIKA